MVDTPLTTINCIALHPDGPDGGRGEYTSLALPERSEGEFMDAAVKYLTRNVDFSEYTVHTFPGTAFVYSTMTIKGVYISLPGALAASLNIPRNRRAELMMNENLMDGIYGDVVFCAVSTEGPSRLISLSEELFLQTEILSDPGEYSALVIDKSDFSVIDTFTFKSISAAMQYLNGDFLPAVETIRVGPISCCRLLSIDGARECVFPVRREVSIPLNIEFSAETYSLLRNCALELDCNGIGTIFQRTRVQSAHCP